MLTPEDGNRRARRSPSNVQPEFTGVRLSLKPLFGDADLSAAQKLLLPCLKQGILVVMVIRKQQST